LGPFPP